MASLSKTLVLFCVFVVISICEAKEFQVGGRKGSWEIPSSPDQFNIWAQARRFQIGDSIVLKYDGKSDSVLQVNAEDYNSCNKTNPIKSYNDGDTIITFDKSGPFFFISGAEGHCEKGQKLEIRVLSPNHGSHSLSPAPSPVVDDDLLHHAPAPAPRRAGGAALKAGFCGGVAALGLFLVFVN